MLSKDRQELIDTLLDTITGDDEIDSLLLSAANALVDSKPYVEVQRGVGEWEDLEGTA